MKTKKIKNLKQKIIIPIIVLLLFNFAMPNYSKADAGDVMDDIGGVLLEPICDILVAIGDAGNWAIGVATGETGKPVISGKKALNFIKTHEKDMKDSAPQRVISIGDDIKQGDKVKIPNIKVTPAEIFSGKVAIVDADFFRNVSEEEYNNTMIGGTKESAAWNLKKTISSWYQALRLIAIVGLLSVLVYIAIRIIISSVATDKAKYKQMFVDWVIALCLVFFLHYIMVFTMTMVEELQKMIIGDSQNSDSVYIMNIAMARKGTVENNEQSTDENQSEKYEAYCLNANGEPTYKEMLEGSTVIDTIKNAVGKAIRYGNTLGPVFLIKDLISHNVANSDLTPVVFPTNLTGYARILVDSPHALEKLSYTIMYLALTIYTLYFMFIYIKRVVVLTFLTIIAPLVALTYPIDKAKDSRAQAFEYWLREYVVNAILPLIHLVLYTVLVTAAIDLVVNVPFYAICVLAFIVPAEKMIKSMFGIKSETAPTLGGFAGGALAAQMLQNLAKGKGKEKSKGGSDKIRTKDNGNVTDPNVVEGDGLDALAEGGTAAQMNAGEEQQLPGQTAMEGFEDENQQGQSGQTGAPQMNLQDAEDATVPAMPEGTENDEESEDNNSKNSYRKNFENMIRRKYDLPKGKTGKVLLKKAGKKAGRIFLKGAAITGGAAIGLAGGIVGGDLGDMWKGASLGAIAGNSIGKGAVNKISNTASSLSGMAEEIRYGSKEAQNRAADKEFMNNVDNRQHIADAIKKENPEIKRKELNAELEKRMEEYAKYRRTGVTDIKEMDKLHSISSQIQSGGTSEETARKQTLEIAKLSTHYNVETFRDAGKIEKATQALAQRFEKKGLSKAQAAAAANNAMNHVRSIKGE